MKFFRSWVKGGLRWGIGILKIWVTGVGWERSYRIGKWGNRVGFELSVY